MTKLAECAVLVLLCARVFAGDELLSVPITSNIRKLVPNESANNPLGETLFPPGGFEVGREGQIQSELLHKYDVSAYVGFPAGVRVFQVTYSTTAAPPSAAYQVYETSVSVTEASSWANTPGPAAVISALLVNVPASQSGKIGVQSAPLTARVQGAIDAGKRLVLVSLQDSTGTTVRMGLQNLRVEVYLKGDADRNDHVNFTDFLIIRLHFGTDTSGLTQLARFERGDFDGDGDVDFTDFLQLSANFDQRLSD